MEYDSLPGGMYWELGEKYRRQRKPTRTQENPGAVRLPAALPCYPMSQSTFRFNSNRHNSWVAQQKTVCAISRRLLVWILMMKFPSMGKRQRGKTVLWVLWFRDGILSVPCQTQERSSYRGWCCIRVCVHKYMCVCVCVQIVLSSESPCSVLQHEEQLLICGWLDSRVSEEACVSLHPPQLIACEWQGRASN